MPSSVAAQSPQIAVRRRRFDYLPDTRADRSEILTWARALMKPDTKVMLIDKHNVKDKWVTVEKAVQSRRSFAIKVRDDILAIDSDKPDLQDALLGLAEVLDREGLRPIPIRSGQPGHAHLWCPIADPILLLRYKQRARGARFDVREGSCLLRPPFARHRKGSPVALARPNIPYQTLRWQTALDDLIREQRKARIESTYRKLLKDPTWCLPGRSPAATPRPQAGGPTTSRVVTPPVARPTTPTSGRLCRPLSPKMERLLREGKPEGQRSEAIQSVALSAVDSSWTEGQFFAALMDPQNRLGDKVRELRGIRAQRRYVSLSWDKALSYAGANPTIADRAEALAEVARLRRAVEQDDWPGVAGTTDRLVMLAHIAIAERAGKLYYSASVREVAEALGIKAETVARSHRRLRDKGWLQLVTPYRRGTTEATIWKVQEPRNSSNPARKIGTVITSGGGVRETVPMVRVVQPHDVWRRGGLGLGAGLVWSQTDAHYPVQAKTVAGDIGKHPSVVRRHFTKLEKHGLVVKEASGWLRGLADLDEVAQVLGVAGKGAKQRAQNIQDREAFLKHRGGVLWAGCRG